MKSSILESAALVTVGLIAIATIEHWMPYWIAAWQFAFGLAFKMMETVL